MGQFRFELVAFGNHGCQREIPAGQKVAECGNPLCADCQLRRFVASFGQNNDILRAVLTHWPDTLEQVQDNLFTGEREGNFPEAINAPQKGEVS